MDALPLFEDKEPCHRYETTGFCPNGTSCGDFHDYSMQLTSTQMRYILDTVVGRLTEVESGLKSFSDRLETVTGKLSKMLERTEESFKALSANISSLGMSAVPITYNLESGRDRGSGRRRQDLGSRSDQLISAQLGEKSTL